jgi:hypothetical protein
MTTLYGIALEPCYIHGYPFMWGPNAVLMHFDPISDSEAATGCIGVSLPAPLLNIGSSLEPVIPFLDIVQGFADILVTS